MQKFFVSNFGVGRPSILSLAGKSVIGPQTCCPAVLSGDEEREDYQMRNRMQYLFSNILGGLVVSESSESCVLPPNFAIPRLAATRALG
jgi:hypothetical protein